MINNKLKKMFKKSTPTLIAVLLAISLCNDSLLALGYINWAAHSATTKSGWISAGSPDPGGSVPNMFDENTSTYYGTQGDDYNVTVYAQTDFSSPHKIEQINVGASISLSGSYVIEAYYDGSWHTVGSGSLSASTVDPIWVNLSGLSLSNVTKVRAGITGFPWNTGWGTWSWCFVYEFYVYGPDYIDTGLRAYDGRAIVKIACDSPEAVSSSLRIKKGSTTSGIKLVDTSDSCASRIRVKTNSGIKALGRVPLNAYYPSESYYSCSRGFLCEPCNLGTVVHYTWSNVNVPSYLNRLRVKYEWKSSNCAYDYYTHNIQVLVNGNVVESINTYQTDWVLRDNIYNVGSYLRHDGADTVRIQLTDTPSNEEDWYYFRNVYFEFQ